MPASRASNPCLSASASQESGGRRYRCRWHRFECPSRSVGMSRSLHRTRSGPWPARRDAAVRFGKVAAGVDRLDLHRAGAVVRDGDPACRSRADRLTPEIDVARRDGEDRLVDGHRHGEGQAARLWSWYVAMISASPSPMAVRNPCASTEATFSSVERYETFDESRTPQDGAVAEARREVERIVLAFHAEDKLPQGRTRSTLACPAARCRCRSDVDRFLTGRRECHRVQRLLPTSGVGGNSDGEAGRQRGRHPRDTDRFSSDDDTRELHIRRRGDQHRQRFARLDHRAIRWRRNRERCSTWLTGCRSCSEQHQQHGGGEGYAARHIEVHHTCTFRTQRCLALAGSRKVTGKL